MRVGISKKMTALAGLVGVGALSDIPQYLAWPLCFAAGCYFLAQGAQDFARAWRGRGRDSTPLVTSEK